MRLLLGYLGTIGLAYYLYAALDHSLHDLNWLTMLGSVGLVVFFLGHYGRELFDGIAQILLGLGALLRTLGNFLRNVPDQFSEALSQPACDSTVDQKIIQSRLQKQLERRFRYAFGASILFFMGTLGATSLFDRNPKVARIEPNSPPRASQPFDKKWIAPGEPADTGGEAALDPWIDDSLQQKQEQTPLPPRPMRKRTERKQMKDPWDFPKF
jgi:hypothetical protein